jgi:hypothetical protein
MERIVTRSVTLELTTFGRESVEDEASKQGVAVETLLRHAILHFLAERESDRMAPRFPRFSRGAPSGGELVEIEVDLDPAEWATLEGAAHEAGVPVGRLLAHASMLYLADLDAGIVAHRLLSDD